MLNFTIDENKKTNFPHYWETCVGSCHAYTALREDYRKQLIKVHKELGFKYVRFHGIFDDEMSVCVENFDFNGKSQGITYNFINIDKIFDFLLTIGMKPFIELSFMPTCLASGKNRIFPYGGNNTMPKTDAMWEELISRFISHLIERYGKEEVESWFFEVWNEPNLPLFFAGNQKDYFHLYQITALAIRKIDSKIKIGGPATSFNSWILEMITFCENNHVPLDFITTHHYPTDDPLWQSGLGIEEFFKNSDQEKTDYHCGILKEMTTKTRQQAKSYPLYYTEWNVSAMVGDQIHDEPYAAAMVAKTLADNDGLVEGYSFFTFTDIFEEQYQKPGVFHGGYGLQTVQGIEKPVYRIFEIYHQLGMQRLKVIDKNQGTAEVLAVQKQKDLQVLVYNHNVPSGKIASEKVVINIAKKKKYKAILQRIDQNHANSFGKWQEIGKPEYLKQAEVDELRKSSELQDQEIEIGKGQIVLEMPPHSCAFTTIHNYFA
ncbi:beta-xylosidase [Lactobacillus sp. ESL0228]|uniref:GH39 family glycosyl hydrolase n=1 Tax=Lactobacillus sp. ESL0228 TaxID=2069352 RepID=UPI000EFAF095|nr:beta-xylosidase [Lactobacillus sp. ESL0228]RMC49747.1 beta-xylosidase [Lactobacillus sp. ESL0228]